MKQIKTVFGFTFKEAVKKKSYIITTIIVMLLILIGMMLPKVFGPSDEDTEGVEETFGKMETIYYVDDNNLIKNGGKALEAKIPQVEVKNLDSKDVEKKRKEIANGDGSEYVVQIIEKETVGIPTVKMITKNFMSPLSGDSVNKVLTAEYRVEKMEESGATQGLIELSQAELSLDVEGAEGGMGITSYVLSIVVSIMMFFAIYYYGASTANSIATEKANRVMETLIVSASPKKILIGKILASGLAGLIQFAGLSLFGVICYKLLVPSDFTVGGIPIDFSSMSASTIVLILVYFVLGYALYSVIFSVAGSLVSKLEDLQSTMMPIMLITLVSFYVGYVGNIVAPNALFIKIATYIPFVTPFVAPSKIISGEMTGMEIGGTVIISIISIIVVTIISMKIYSSSVLKYGGKTKRKKGKLAFGKKEV